MWIFSIKTFTNEMELFLNESIGSFDLRPGETKCTEISDWGSSATVNTPMDLTPTMVLIHNENEALMFQMKFFSDVGVLVIRGNR